MQSTGECIANDVTGYFDRGVLYSGGPDLFGCDVFCCGNAAEIIGLRGIVFTDLLQLNYGIGAVYSCGDAHGGGTVLNEWRDASS
jgi:hypothetical protein